jgi:Recombinase
MFSSDQSTAPHEGLTMASKFFTDEGRKRGRTAGNLMSAHRAIADNWHLLADLFRMRAHGATLRDCAASLNERGIKTRGGKDWSITQVVRLLARVNGRVEFVIQVDRVA